MASKIPSSAGPSPEKAATMLRDGVANGKPITPKQKRFFGARAGSMRMTKRGKRPKAPRRSPR